MYILEYYQSVIRRKERSLLWGTLTGLKNLGKTWIFLDLPCGVPSERLTLRMFSPQKKSRRTFVLLYLIWIIFRVIYSSRLLSSYSGHIGKLWLYPPSY